MLYQETQKQTLLASQARELQLRERNRQRGPREVIKDVAGAAFDAAWKYW